MYDGIHASWSAPFSEVAIYDDVIALADRQLLRVQFSLMSSLSPQGPPMTGGRLTGLKRKLVQLLGDPVLRKWLIGRFVGHHPGEPPYHVHCPPYLAHALPESAVPPHVFSQCQTEVPAGRLALNLPGQTLDIQPGDEVRLFSVPLEDPETWLGLHRFAWVPLAGIDLDPGWVVSLYRAWKERFGDTQGSWAWHPYTAAERAANLISFSSMHGAPEDPAAFADVLRTHADEITKRLEFFGDHHTGNHLANNGRGLYLIGLALGDAVILARGCAIMLAEAKRIFTDSGILREGSSHYHLIVTRWYVEVWLAARRHKRAETADFETIATSVLAAVPSLCLPGGFPLVGDISPDSPPRFLFSNGVFGGDWLAQLGDEDRLAVEGLMKGGHRDLAVSGWCRFATGDWAGLWHAETDGWSHMPGHGHQDLGGFELHWRDVPVFIDAGRGSYGDDGEAALYRSANVHNTLTIDDNDPYPPNRPYYAETFRRKLGGEPPVWSCDESSVSLAHNGYVRLNGVGRVTRRWTFDQSGFSLTDYVEGRGRHIIRRRFITPHPASFEGNKVVIQAPDVTFKISGNRLTARYMKRWVAYGEASDAWVVEMTCEPHLPFEDTLRIDVVRHNT